MAKTPPSRDLILFAVGAIKRNLQRMGYPKPEQAAFVDAQTRRMQNMDRREVAALLLVDLPADYYHREP